MITFEFDKDGGFLSFKHDDWAYRDVDFKYLCFVSGNGLSIPREIDLEDGKYVDRYGQTIIVEDNLIHNSSGPAVRLLTSNIWFDHGKHHREDGPAVEYDSGARYWWWQGKRYRNMDEWAKAAGIYDTDAFTLLKLKWG